MELTNTFTVRRPTPEVWEALQDLEQMALCMPGATLTSLDGDAFTGKVALRVGPVMMTYTGQGVIEHRDELGRVMSLRLRGKEAKGAGTAAALVTASLNDKGADGTRVDVVTELDLTGKPAQFGRGVLAEVAGVIISKFAKNLADRLEPAVESPATAASDRDVTESVGKSHASGFVDRSGDNVLDLGRLALLLSAGHTRELRAAGASVLALLAFLLGRYTARRSR